MSKCYLGLLTFGTSVAYDSVGALGPLLSETVAPLLMMHFTELHMGIDAKGLADLYSM